MRKLLNTVYFTNELSYITLDGENLISKVDNKVVFRIPFQNVENIVCFNYMGCSPQVMGKCVENSIPINFLSPQGYFLAKVTGETRGNVFSRIAQIDMFREKAVELSGRTIATKLLNSISLIKRSQHDKQELRNNDRIQKVIDTLSLGIERVLRSDTIEEIIGIEGNCAKEYFSVFNLFFTDIPEDMRFINRSKRPPLDPVNAVLSFLYTLFTSEYSAALETVGLDSYIGYCHALKSGRSSLACDLVEETRALIERFVITLFNLKILSRNDFDFEIGGAVFLNKEGRKKVITKWQERKKTSVNHPYLREKVPFGLIPYIQANLLSKYIRGEIEEYPNYIIK